MRIVKIFNQEEREIESFSARSKKIADKSKLVHKTWTTVWPLIVFLIALMTIIVWFFALPRLFGIGAIGEPTIDPGLFVSFLIYMGMFIGPIDNIGMSARETYSALSSAQRVFEILDTEPDQPANPEPVDPGVVQGDIEFRDVIFSYLAAKPALRGINFHIRPGEVVGVVGRSGSGKSTIMNLLARFYDPQGGRILVDGQDILDLDLKKYRSNLGMVLQDPYLFSASILDNIRYGHPTADLETVVDAAKSAHAHEFISKLPHGYDTLVGERGSTLSGGEKQRISIARAILHDPRILMLDEATSSVDSETETYIQEGLEHLFTGRTVIVIAHRLSTLRRADRILVVDDGKIVEDGTQAELLNIEQGAYRKLLLMQAQLNDVPAT